MMGSLGCLTCYKVLHRNLPGRRANACGAVCMSSGTVQPGALEVCFPAAQELVTCSTNLFCIAAQSPCCCELRAAKLLNALRAGALAGPPLSVSVGVWLLVEVER